MRPLGQSAGCVGACPRWDTCACQPFYEPRKGFRWRRFLKRLVLLPIALPFLVLEYLLD